MKTRTACRLCMPSGSSVEPFRDRSLFPPQDRAAFHKAVLQEILDERVVSSRQRQTPRGVKRKMSNYPLRPRRPRPTHRLAITVCVSYGEHIK
jgi:hypothetical protein